MQLTWFGHSAFCVELDDARILIDPFLSGNPSWGGGWREVAEGTTHVLLTHGHDDHLGDAADVLKATGAMLVATFEGCMHLVGQGVSDGKINPGNHGGTVDCGGFTTSFVKAEHSSSGGTGDGTVYLGSAGGLIVKAPGQPTLYHMGDTDIFSDMALIAELHAPEIGIVPIGDRFTMGAATAALACRRFFDFKAIVPCHYGTFPIIDRTADGFRDAMGDSAGAVVVPAIGESFGV